MSKIKIFLLFLVFVFLMASCQTVHSCDAYGNYNKYKINNAHKIRKMSY